jgi:urease accessory protein
MPWQAKLDLNYSLQEARSVARFEHTGPLRILQSLYPQGDAVCHNVLVHPPGGLVGGDTLDIHISLKAKAQALITTPGATRFYRSGGETARQSVHAHLGPDTRLEWLPLEALAYNACVAENRAVFELDPGAELLGWDITALGLPAAELPFASGVFSQHLEVPGLWLERACIDAHDTRLMNSPLGLHGKRCLATLFFIAGSPLDRSRREAALDAARAVMHTHALGRHCGATAPNPQMIVLRVLSPLVEPAMGLLKGVREAWRACLWQSLPCNPRIWST